MYPNVSQAGPATSVVPSSSASTIEIRTARQALPLQGSSVVPWAPIMRSKPPSQVTRVGPPDFAGMRERRTQTDMTVKQLQRSRGVLRPVESMPSAGWTTAISSMGAQAWQALTEAFSLEVGPPGAAAAPVIANAPTLDEFQQKFSNDFEIWISPAARGSVDMKGMIVVLGEDHYDEGISASIERVMRGFRRGDRFFKEGGTEGGCREREAMYGLRKGDCRLLEKGVPIVSQMNEALEDLLVKLKACVDYLRKHVPAAAKEQVRAMNAQYYDEFIKRYSRDLPPAAAAGFQPLLRASEAKFDELDASAIKQNEIRNQYMANKLRTSCYPGGVNYAIVGAAHLQGMRAHLRDLPCVFILPKALLGNPHVPSLLDSNRDEL
jgi:hypothetical protein